YVQPSIVRQRSARCCSADGVAGHLEAGRVVRSRARARTGKAANCSRSLDFFATLRLNPYVAPQICCPALAASTVREHSRIWTSKYLSTGGLTRRRARKTTI